MGEHRDHVGTVLLSGEEIQELIGSILEDRLRALEERVVERLQGRENPPALLSAEHSSLTVKAVAKRLNVTERTVRRWTKAHKLPSPARIGGCLRYERSEFEAWLSQSKAEGRP